MRRKVVLPEPFGPNRQNTSPRRMLRSRQSITVNERNRLLTRSARIAGGSPVSPNRSGIRMPRSVVEIRRVLRCLEQLGIVRHEELRALGVADQPDALIALIHSLRPPGARDRRHHTPFLAFPSLTLIPTETDLTATPHPPP